MSNTRISYSLLLVLAYIQGERSTLSLLQVLDIPLAQAELTLLHLQSSGLICEAESEHHWCLTENGREQLPDAIAALKALEERTGVEELLLLCEKKAHRSACTHGIVVMYSLLDTGRTPGAMICLDILRAQMWLWHAHVLAASEISSFLECAFSLSDVSLFLMRDIDATGRLIQTAIQSAMEIGDSRTLVLLQFLRGYHEMSLSSNNFAQVHATFSESIHLLGNLGDKEIYSRASSFLVLFHFIKGDFQRAMENYEFLQRTKPSTILYYMEKQLVLYAASSLTYLGHFSHAYGMLNSAISTASLSGNALLNLLYKQHLGTLLIYMGRHDEGINMLQSVVAQTTITANPKIMVRAFAGIAYSHFKKGNVALSHQVFSNAATLLARHKNFALSFNYPWMLELIGTYTRHDLAVPHGMDLDTLFLNAEASPSLMLQGQAMRFRAGQLIKQKAPLETALSCLDMSLSLLTCAHTPIEVASTEVERAAVLHSLGRNEDAKNAEKHSQQLFKQYLLGSGNTLTEKKDELSVTSLLDDCYTKLSTHSYWETVDEATQELALIARQIFDMERTALFRIQNEHVVCASSCNISTSEQNSETFSHNKSIINRQIYVDTPFRCTKNDFTLVCVPFSIPDAGRWILYADSSLPFHRAAQPSDDTLRHIGQFFALALRPILRKGVTHTESRQNDTVVSRELLAPVLWGTSPSFRLCLEQAAIVASTDAPVLLLGESGVGKEVMAKFIHKNSNTSGPFVAVHPASISEALFESEFFGHEKGAFTGAVKQKIGLFELANQGTLFIDETGDIPLSMQIKLLRVLQERTFMRVGGIKEIHSSFRLITATNRDLLDAVRCGTFREDLYYRLSVVPLTIPPLRERKEDIEELLLCFITYFSERYRKSVPVPEKGVIRQLTDYCWPGNLRELKNSVERAVILYSEGDLDLWVGKSIAAHASSGAQSSVNTALYADMPSLEELQQRYIAYVLERTSGKVCGLEGAESILKMKRSTLYLKLRQFGIDRKCHRTDASKKIYRIDS